ncbi:protein of unknown function (DUF303) [Echinicola vietnamensis DSM 17526]|uniref:Sialate O-acetylesterase domain-containing protein n=2 Tax=Echinicola TaxID=390846 RepID=L0G4D5_ECHVK|nr:protein of unknown function (DUF303) [Echinicola vietnamensis DSM 17526]
MKRKHLSSFFCLLAVCTMMACRDRPASVTLHNLFSDHMVLQREKPIPIWGKALPGTVVTVKLNGFTASSEVGEDSTWLVELPAQKKGGPYQLEVLADSTLKLEDVWLGDVWVCSGQSNMEWPLERAGNASEEIRQANYSQIRLFDVPHQMEQSPSESLPDSVAWKVCSPETIKNFSAVGYFFGRELQQELDVPIGLISSNWGGTNVEAWTSAAMIGQFPSHRAKIAAYDSINLKEMTSIASLAIDSWLQAIDSLDLGLQENWSNPEIEWENSSTVVLPEVFERLDVPNTDGVIWFKKTLYLSENEANQDAEISLGRIDEEDFTYVNGQLVGSMIGTDPLRSYKIKQGVLNEGLNTIIVRVKDKGWTGGFKGTPQQMNLALENKKLDLSGEWEMNIGTVDLPIAPKNIHPNNFPTTLFNGMIKPLIPFSIKGAIWYQGESNATRAYAYREMFPAMIKDWRVHWGQGDFPFYFVQLANYRAEQTSPGESTWAEVRESQMAALKLPHTGMAVAIDLGEADNIHPKNKQEVGRRLALEALSNTYHHDILSTGPTYSRQEVLGDKLRLVFSNIGDGMTTGKNDKELRGFAIAGKDKQFYWAKAVLESDSTILVSSQYVVRPQAVRYAWADNPGALNLYNSVHLPASPFRTDSWKVSTE